jgi:hypothetical protein
LAPHKDERQSDYASYETRPKADGTGQIGVSRTGKLKRVVGKSIFLQGSPLFDPPPGNPQVLRHPVHASQQLWAAMVNPSGRIGRVCLMISTLSTG